jgi:hypothetical protein
VYKRKRVIWSQSVGDKSDLIINSGVDKVITKVRYSYAKDTLAAECRAVGSNKDRSCIVQ